jgi:hypothetical protein
MRQPRHRGVQRARVEFPREQKTSCARHAIVRTLHSLVPPKRCIVVLAVYRVLRQARNQAQAARIRRPLVPGARGRFMLPAPVNEHDGPIGDTAGVFQVEHGLEVALVEVAESATLFQENAVNVLILHERQGVLPIERHPHLALADLLRGEVWERGGVAPDRLKRLHKALVTAREILVSVAEAAQGDGLFAQIHKPRVVTLPIQQRHGEQPSHCVCQAPRQALHVLARDLLPEEERRARKCEVRRGVHV